MPEQDPDPSLTGVHHVGLTVSDVERSARWYQEVLRFYRVARFGGPDDPRRKIFLHHPRFGMRLGLVEHSGGSDWSPSRSHRTDGPLATARPRGPLSTAAGRGGARRAHGLLDVDFLALTTAMGTRLPKPAETREALLRRA